MEGQPMRSSRIMTFVGAALFVLCAAAAPAAVSTDIDAPADIPIGSINTDGSETPKATLPRGMNVQQPQQRQEEPALPGNPLWAVPLKDLTATRERPIFSLSRRPPTPAVIATPAAAVVAPPKPVEPSRPQLTLVGTIVGVQRGFGIFQDQAANKALRLQTGEVHEGWVLREVRARATVFQKNDVRVTLELPVQTSGSSSAAASVTSAEPRSRR
jgi:general secretion pathway protein N